jgi:hypothetical protein
VSGGPGDTDDDESEPEWLKCKLVESVNNYSVYNIFMAVEKGETCNDK